MVRGALLVAALGGVLGAVPACSEANAQIAAIDVTRSAIWLWDGDSLSDAAFPYQMLGPLWEAQEARYNPKSAPGWNGTARLPSVGLGSPRVVNKAINGSRMQDIDARIDTELTANPYTHVALCVGTNERTILRASTQASIASIAAKIPANVWVLLVGPYAWGEKRPGPNNIAGAADNRLDETDIDLPAIFIPIHPKTVYVSLRLTMYAAIVAPGADIGAYTVDGAHWNPAGRAAAVTLIRPYVHFQRRRRRLPQRARRHCRGMRARHVGGYVSQADEPRQNERQQQDADHR